MTTYQEAQAAVARLEQEVADYRQQQAARQQELAQLQASAGERLAGGASSSDLSREAAALSDEMSFLGSVCQSVEAKLGPARRAVQLARVEALRAEATRLEAEAQPI